MYRLARRRSPWAGRHEPRSATGASACARRRLGAEQRRRARLNGEDQDRRRAGTGLLGRGVLLEEEGDGRPVALGRVGPRLEGPSAGRVGGFRGGLVGGLLGGLRVGVDGDGAALSVRRARRRSARRDFLGRVRAAGRLRTAAGRGSGARPARGSREMCCRCPPLPGDARRTARRRRTSAAAVRSAAARFIGSRAAPVAGIGKLAIAGRGRLGLLDTLLDDRRVDRARRPGHGRGDRAAVGERAAVDHVVDRGARAGRVGLVDVGVVGGVGLEAVDPTLFLAHALGDAAAVPRRGVGDRGLSLEVRAGGAERGVVGRIDRPCLRRGARRHGGLGDRGDLLGLCGGTVRVDLDLKRRLGDV